MRLDEALPIAKQMAEALEAAHDEIEAVIRFFGLDLVPREGHAHPELRPA